MEEEEEKIKENKQAEKIKIKLIKYYHTNLHFEIDKKRIVIRMAEEYRFLLPLIQYVEEHGTKSRSAYVYQIYRVTMTPTELMKLLRPKKASKYFNKIKELVSSS